MGKITFLLPKPLIHFAPHHLSVTAPTHAPLIPPLFAQFVNNFLGSHVRDFAFISIRLQSHLAAHIRPALKLSSGEPGLALFAPILDEMCSKVKCRACPAAGAH